MVCREKSSEDVNNFKFTNHNAHLKITGNF